MQYIIIRLPAANVSSSTVDLWLRFTRDSIIIILCTRGFVDKISYSLQSIYNNNNNTETVDVIPQSSATLSPVENNLIMII